MPKSPKISKPSTSNKKYSQKQSMHLYTSTPQQKTAHFSSKLFTITINKSEKINATIICQLISSYYSQVGQFQQQIQKQSSQMMEQKYVVGMLLKYLQHLRKQLVMKVRKQEMLDADQQLQIVLIVQTLIKYQMTGQYLLHAWLPSYHIISSIFVKFPRSLCFSVCKWAQFLQFIISATNMEQLNQIKQNGMSMKIMHIEVAQMILSLYNRNKDIKNKQFGISSQILSIIDKAVQFTISNNSSKQFANKFGNQFKQIFLNLLLQLSVFKASQYIVDNQCQQQNDEAQENQMLKILNLCVLYFQYNHQNIFSMQTIKLLHQLRFVAYFQRGSQLWEGLMNKIWDNVTYKLSAKQSQFFTIILCKYAFLLESNDSYKHKCNKWFSLYFNCCVNQMSCLYQRGSRAEDRDACKPIFKVLQTYISMPTTICLLSILFQPLSVGEELNKIKLQQYISWLIKQACRFGWQAPYQGLSNIYSLVLLLYRQYCGLRTKLRYQQSQYLQQQTSNNKFGNTQQFLSAMLTLLHDQIVVRVYFGCEMGQKFIYATCRKYLYIKILAKLSGKLAQICKVDYIVFLLTKSMKWLRQQISLNCPAWLIKQMSATFISLCLKLKQVSILFQCQNTINRQKEHQQNFQYCQKLINVNHLVDATVLQNYCQEAIIAQLYARSNISNIDAYKILNQCIVKVLGFQNQACDEFYLGLYVLILLANQKSFHQLPQHSYHRSLTPLLNTVKIFAEIRQKQISQSYRQNLTNALQNMLVNKNINQHSSFYNILKWMMLQLRQINVMNKYKTKMEDQNGSAINEKVQLILTHIISSLTQCNAFKNQIKIEKVDKKDIRTKSCFNQQQQNGWQQNLLNQIVNENNNNNNQQTEFQEAIKNITYKINQIIALTASHLAMHQMLQQLRSKQINSNITIKADKQVQKLWSLYKAVASYLKQNHKMNNLSIKSKKVTHFILDRIYKPIIKQLTQSIAFLNPQNVMIVTTLCSLITICSEHDLSETKFYLLSKISHIRQLYSSIEQFISNYCGNNHIESVSFDFLNCNFQENYSHTNIQIVHVKDKLRMIRKVKDQSIGQ